MQEVWSTCCQLARLAPSPREGMHRIRVCSAHSTVDRVKGRSDGAREEVTSKDDAAVQVPRVWADVYARSRFGRTPTASSQRRRRLEPVAGARGASDRCELKGQRDDAKARHVETNWPCRSRGAES